MQGLTMGIVRGNSDPDEMGRLKIFIPTIDSANAGTEDLPWAMYVSPFGGAAQDLKVGREDDLVGGLKAYGMWNIPKIGAQVLVAFLNGDPNFRIYLGCFFPTFNNFTLPGGKNSGNGNGGSGVPKTNDNKPITHMQKQLEKAGLLGRYDRSRGGWQRNVAEDLANAKTSKEGYNANPANTKALDSQVFSWTSPGGHYMVMDDSSSDCRTRIRTIAGHQIILDDSNERIYMSTCGGDNWIEMDEDGHIHIYGKQKISIHSEQNINLISDKSINLQAKDDINLQAGKNVNYEAGVTVNGKAAGGSMNMEGSTAVNVKSGGPLNATSSSATNILSSGGSVNVQGIGAINIKSSATVNIMGGGGINMGSAGGAGTAAAVAGLSLDLIIPMHEPWSRPAPEKARNKNWKE